ncbi:MAG: glycoside hydrolase family 25 protein [bacterium]|nr:glycoside hydrolase family 25 protein [bacterium]MCM1376618.1 glycoside hydrolase family 25 protein [Muribaculum sp.]
MEHGKKGKRKVARVLYVVLLLTSVSVILIAFKIIKIPPYLAAQYPMQGVDVSHYQGEIEWERIREQGIDFAFIKATEGSSFVDDRFAANWKEARSAGLYVGAYHFFSFDSPASSQAEHFIATVGSLSGALPPAVDIEYYGDKAKNPPERQQAVSQLRELLCALEEEYGVKPVIYTTYTIYGQYIRGEFEEYPLWIRNVYYPPVNTGRHWTFWQYCDTGTLQGTSGEEKYVDLNVFREGQKELEELLVP